MFVNPMYEGLQNKMKYMWPEATLASLLGISALNISELGKWVLFVSLSAYACILLLRKVDGDAPDINYVSYAKELAECPTEDVPGLIEEIKQKERDMKNTTSFFIFPYFLGVSFCMVQVEEPDLQVEPIGKCSCLSCTICRVACCSCVNWTLGVVGALAGFSRLDTRWNKCMIFL